MAKRFKGIPNLPFAPIVAGLFGLASVALVFATPNSLLERAVSSLGLAQIIPAAQPPLGDTARLLLALMAGALVFLGLWLVMRPIERAIHKRRVAQSGSQSPVHEAQPVSRARDIRARNEEVAETWTPRAGRSPIFAERDLGAPLMSDEALASGEELILDQAMVDEVLPSHGQTEYTAEKPEQVPLDLTIPVAETKPTERAAPDMTIGQWAAPVEASGETVARSPEPITQAALPAEENSPLHLEPPHFEPEANSPPPEVLEHSVEPAQAAYPVRQSDVRAEVSDPLNSIIFETVGQGEAEKATPIPVETAAPVVLDAPTLVETPVSAEAGTADQEPSLRELLDRFEAALAKRSDRAASGEITDQAPSAGTVSALRDLLRGNRKSAA